MTLDVPVLNDDGSLKFTATLTADQVQVLLQFAMNLTMAAGLATHIGIAVPDLDDNLNPKLND